MGVLLDLDLLSGVISHICMVKHLNQWVFLNMENLFLNRCSKMYIIVLFIHISYSNVVWGEGGGTHTVKLI